MHTVGPSRRLAAKAAFGCFLAAAVLVLLLLGIGIFQVARGQPHVSPSTAGPLQPTSGNTQQTLADAIAQTPDGGTLQLAAGTFDLGSDRLEIAKSIHLVGSGSAITKIVGQAKTAIVKVAGDVDFSANGISFARTGGDGSALLLNCRRATIASCLFLGSTEVKQKWRYESLWITGHTVATVRGCRALDGMGGIGAGGNCRATLSHNVCKQNVDGIIVYQQARVELRDNTCAANRNSGILFQNHARGAALKNRCTDNRWGIAVNDEAHPRLKGNVCKKNSVANVSDHRRK